MQVVVRQISGLGNQLFQYAAGRFYAMHYGADLRLAVEPQEQAISHGAFARPFLLSHFSLQAPAVPLTVQDRLVLSPRERTQKVAGAFNALSGVQVLTEDLKQRYRFLPPPTLPRRTRALYVVGYWQNYTTVAGAAATLRQEFRLRAEATGRNLDLLRRIQATSNSVSVHVRGGDYALAVEGNIVLPGSYYARAIEMLRERYEDLEFFVFSDDMPFARKLLPANLRATFVEGNDDHASHEDLRLMSACRHHIIANSTFSWWGAWLEAQPEAVVIAPRHWLLEPDSFFPDLFPPQWHLVDSLRQRPSGEPPKDKMD